MQILKKFTKQSNFTTQVLIMVGIVLVLNFLSYQIFKRFDLTQNNIYSISNTSKETVKNLDDLVNIKVYFSEQLPPQYILVRQEVEDILDEYKNYANNKIQVEFIDPANNEDLKTELMLLGIPQLQFNVLENDKYQIINGFLGIGVFFGDKKQAIPVVDNTQNLEYQLTSSIKKVTADEIPIIGIATGHGESNLENEMSLVNKKLSEIYEIRTIDLSTGEEITGVDTLIIIGTKEEFSERALFIVDQFLMGGGSVLIAAKGMAVDENLQAIPNTTGLNKILDAYGLQIKPNLIADISNEMASFNQGFVTFTTQYPYWVKIIKEGFDQENAAVAKLQSLSLPWVSEITIEPGKILEGQVSYLAQTTPKAWRVLEGFNLNPQGDFGFNEDAEKYTLVAGLRGKINSAFTDYIPKESESGDVLGSAENARLILISDADFANDGFINRFPDNLLFFQNIVDSLSLDEGLINIRSKTIQDRPLKELSDSSKMVIKFVNIFGLTLLVLSIGLGRYFMRRKSNFADEL